MRSQEFYQRHLDAVSRSFALCIPELAPPLGPQVALSYLLLRVLDTVEDAAFPDKALQQHQFNAFRQLLANRPGRAQIDAFRSSFPAGITEGERNLLADTESFVEDYHQLPAAARGIVVSAIDRMAQGMSAYARRSDPLRLLDLEDVSRYCCIVAGLVGELLTRLWALGGGTPPRMLLAYRFGMFLQKVNILKDQAEDEAAGRFLVPDRREILSSLRADAEGALSYLTSLPANARGYRIFCAWSLMLGAAALGQMDGPRESRRAQTMGLISRTAEIVQDDEALRRQFESLLPRFGEGRIRPPLEKPEPQDWFVQMLDAPLSENDLIELGALHAESRAVAGNQ
ncbi:MAG TPA: squalene/phytoene synthase family protein [Myxococcales bacterium]|jgi:phytoene/squalene synthetase|nr:squalene/phytoene synthase family protein [Myxococcales bacterium]